MTPKQSGLKLRTTFTPELKSSSSLSLLANCSESLCAGATCWSVWSCKTWQDCVSDHSFSSASARRLHRGPLVYCSRAFSCITLPSSLSFIFRRLTCVTVKHQSKKLKRFIIFIIPPYFSVQMKWFWFVSSINLPASHSATSSSSLPLTLCSFSFYTVF